MLRWKLLLSLVVLAPLLAYVAGTLASGSDGPVVPTPVILEQSGGGSPDDASPATTRAPQPIPSPSPTGGGGDVQRGDDDNGRGDDEGGEGGPVVVTPRPTGLEDDEAAGGDDDDDTGADDRDDDGDDDGDDSDTVDD